MQQGYMRCQLWVAPAPINAGIENPIQVVPNEYLMEITDQYNDWQWIKSYPYHAGLTWQSLSMLANKLNVFNTSAGMVDREGQLQHKG